MDVHHTILLSVLIFAAATLYSSVGHAGASAYLAVMALAGLDPQIMKPTALTLNVLVAIIATVRFHRAGCFVWPIFWPFAVTSVPAALLGGFLTLPDLWYKQVVGAVLLLAAYRLFRHAAATAGPGRRPLALSAALAAGTVIGLLSGLTGVGGGIFLTPLLLLVGWADARHATGVSAAFILANSLAGLGGHLAAFRELPSAVLPWGAAAIAGGLLGSSIGARRLGEMSLRRVLAVVLVIAAIKLLFL